MKVTIQRGERMQVYQVPSCSTSVTVMAVLDYIYQELDHTLAYYRHSSCCQAACGRCLVKLDGAAVLACAKEIPPGTEEIVLTPAGERVVRDLVSEPLSWAGDGGYQGREKEESQ